MRKHSPTESDKLWYQNASETELENKDIAQMLSPVKPSYTIAYTSHLRAKERKIRGQLKCLAMLNELNIRKTYTAEMKNCQFIAEEIQNMQQQGKQFRYHSSFFSWSFPKEHS
jgi:hypothetical protein